MDGRGPGDRGRGGGLVGWLGEGWSVSVTLDAHAGELERAHDALWQQMREQLEAVKNDPQYEQLNPM